MLGRWYQTPPAQRCHVSRSVPNGIFGTGFPSQQAGLVTGAVTLEIKTLQLPLLALMRGTLVLSWPEGSSSSLFCHFTI